MESFAMTTDLYVVPEARRIVFHLPTPEFQGPQARVTPARAYPKLKSRFVLLKPTSAIALNGS